jgi:transcriptional regulator with XRE-family HTH domain
MDNLAMASGAQIRAARALLGWSVRDLAHRAVVSLSTVNSLEGGAGPPAVSDKKLAAIRGVLEAAGIEFTNGHMPGVRLNPKKRK